VLGDSGRNVVPTAAEEYNVVSALVTKHSTAALVAMVTRRKSRDATLSRAKVSVSNIYYSFIRRNCSCNARDSAYS